MSRTEGPDCVCGHAVDTHQHYRPGTDCGLCGPQLCPSYTSSEPGVLARVVRWVRSGVSRREQP